MNIDQHGGAAGRTTCSTDIDQLPPCARQILTTDHVTNTIRTLFGAQNVHFERLSQIRMVDKLVRTIRFTIDAPNGHPRIPVLMGRSDIWIEPTAAELGQQRWQRFHEELEHASLGDLIQKFFEGRARYVEEGIDFFDARAAAVHLTMITLPGDGMIAQRRRAVVGQHPHRLIDVTEWVRPTEIARLTTD